MDKKCCARCRFLEKINDEPIYAVCENKNKTFLLWENDTRKNCCENFSASELKNENEIRNKLEECFILLKDPSYDKIELTGQINALKWVLGE